MDLMRLTRAALGVALALVFAQNFARTQDASYPNRPIKMLVGFGAGGGTDIVARIMAQKMSESLGQSIVVENRTGEAFRHFLRHDPRDDVGTAAGAKADQHLDRPVGIAGILGACEILREDKRKRDTECCARQSH